MIDGTHTRPPDLTSRRLSPIAVAMALATPLLLAGATLWPRDGRAMAVVVAPYADSTAAIGVVIAAEGSIVAATPLASIVVARSDRPDFARRLYAAGAWLVLDAPIGCEPEPPAVPISIAKDFRHV